MKDGSARRSPTKTQRESIRKKTGGLCHICGGRLGPRWTADHVKPVASGGDSTEDNFLPACGTCNRMKWHRKPAAIRRVLQMGVYCKREIENGTPLGRELEELYRKRQAASKSRRI